MFKNREFRVRMVKTPPIPSVAPDTAPAVDPTQLSQIAKDQATHVAILIGAAYASKVVLDTASRIFVLYARHKLR